MLRHWHGIIVGEPASKSNSSEIITIGGRWATMGGRRTRIGGMPRLIKSAKARAYAKSVALQVPVLSPMLGGRLAVYLRIFYASERPDLDPSLILDSLQGRIYANDRAVRELHVVHAIDRHNPRAQVLVQEIGAPLLEARAA